MTIYIKGRENFQEFVLEKLDGAWLSGSTDSENSLVMYWLPDATRLRLLKIAIGAKLIFKYRLEFFTDLDIYLKNENPPSTDFSVSENEMVSKMELREKSFRENPPDDMNGLFSRLATEESKLRAKVHRIRSNNLRQFTEVLV